MKALKTIEDRVKVVLTKDEKSRDDDMLLYLKICNSDLKDAGAMSFAEVMTQYKLLGLPHFESVRRSRQKLQAAYPELVGSPRTQRLRAELEQVYRQYAGVPMEHQE